MSIAVGTRVVRGPDWKWEDQDYGEGHVGTVISVGEGKLADRPEKTVMVMWDRGRRNNYRAGFNNCFDLRIFDNAQTGVVHTDVSCSICNREGICGIRWKCFRCFNCNLCTPCFMSGSHNIGHDFQRFVTTDSAGTRLFTRNGAKEVDALGFFPAAQVQRGNDWRYGDQDGGDTSRPGVLIDVRGWHDTGNRAAVGVRWQGKDSSKMYRYRVGSDGKVDIKCVKAGNGGTYYPDLLPALGENAGLRVGDTVFISLNKDTIKTLRDTQRPLPDDIERKSKGTIKGVTSEGDLEVEFKAGQSVKINPIAVQKVAAFTVGDRVRINGNVSQVERLQHGHGGWNGSMSKVLGREGHVEQVYSDGDVKVRISGSKLLFNPACVELVESGQHGKTFEQDPEDGMHSLTQQMPSINLEADQSEQRQLSKAAALGRLIEVKEILRAHPDWIDSLYSGRTPLQVAAHQGQLEVVKELMKHSPSREIMDKDGDTALLYATYGNAPKMLAYLIEKGCFVNVTNKQRRSCLHIAARRGHLECVQLLLKAGCDCNMKDKAGDLALHDAIHKDKQNVIKCLVSWTKSDLRLKNKRGMSPLHYAALRGNAPATQCLVSHDLQLVKEKTNDGQTPLHVATSNNFSKVAEILITMGKSELDKYDDNRLTPLLVAVQGGHAELTVQLVTAGADVNATNDEGDTCLHIAVLRFKHNPSGKEASTFTKLCYGVSETLLKIPGAALLIYLIQQGANFKIPNQMGRTPLQVLENSDLERKLLQIPVAEHTSSNNPIPYTDSMNSGNISEVFNLMHDTTDPKDADPSTAGPRVVPEAAKHVKPKVDPQRRPQEDPRFAQQPIQDKYSKATGIPTVQTAFEGVHRIEVNEVQLQGLIGKGSFAQVYKGRWRGTIVAVKKMAIEGSKRSEVEQEVAIHKRAMHPNIVQLMAIGYGDGSAFLVMNYINGQTLHNAIFPAKEKCALTVPEKNAIARDILSALTFMHTSGMLHLDIKPSNILLEKLTLKPYLCDLGLSYVKRRAEMHLSSHISSTRGTPMYMAPEMSTESQNLRVSGAQDIWSVGCTLLELFGECPVHPPNVTFFGLAVRYAERRFVPDSLRRVKPPHHELLKMCFHGNAKERPPASDLLDKFTELCENPS